MAAQRIPLAGLIATKGIELLTYGTPNGFRVAILLEELRAAYNTPYTVQTIDIAAGEQKAPWFLELCPNGRIPVIVDHDNDRFAVFEGPAILSYLVGRYDVDGKFGFEDARETSAVEMWMSWMQGGLGPMQTQANAYYRFNPVRHAYPTQRFVGETERHYGVLDARLAERDYIAGHGRGKYSIADIAMWPFVDAIGVAGIDLQKFPNVLRWWARVGERPAVKKGMCVPSGEEFRYGYAQLQKLKQEDPKVWEENEGPLRDALEKAQKEFGYVYKSP